MNRRDIALVLALSGSLPASAMAFQDPAPLVRLRTRLIDADGKPLKGGKAVFRPGQVDARGVRSHGELTRPPFIEFESQSDGTLESPPLSLGKPIAGDLFVSADAHADVLFRLAYGRAEEGVIDLGDLPLEPGVDATIRVHDANGAPALGVGVHYVYVGHLHYPWRDPSWKVGRTGRRWTFSLDDSSRIGFTDANGELSFWRHPDEHSFALVANDREVVEFEMPDEGVATVKLGAGKRLALDISTGDPERWLAEPPDFDFRLKYAGTLYWSPKLRPDETGALRAEFILDVDDAEKLTIGARGFKSEPLSLTTFPTTSRTSPLKLHLEPLPRRYATLAIVEAVTKRPLTPTSLRLGRARVSDPSDKDRIDFAPDWDSFVIRAGPPALAIGPEEPVDLLVAAEGHLETLVRGLRFLGTKDSPTPITVELPSAGPVAGLVTDVTTGAPIANASVLVRRSSRDFDNLPPAWKLCGVVGFVGGTTTNANGRFDLMTSARESFVLEISATGYATTTLGPIDRAAASSVRVSLTRGFRFAGKATGAIDGDVVGMLEPIAMRWTSVPIGTDGHFEFDSVARGKYRVFVSPDPRRKLSGFCGSEGSFQIELFFAKGGHLVDVDVTKDVSDFVLAR